MLALSAEDRTIKHISGVQVALPVEFAAVKGLQIRNDDEMHTAEVGTGILWVKVALLFEGRLQEPFFRQEMRALGWGSNEDEDNT